MVSATPDPQGVPDGEHDAKQPLWIVLCERQVYLAAVGVATRGAVQCVVASGVQRCSPALQGDRCVALLTEAGRERSLQAAMLTSPSPRATHSVLHDRIRVVASDQQSSGRAAAGADVCPARAAAVLRLGRAGRPLGRRAHGAQSAQPAADALHPRCGRLHRHHLRQHQGAAALQRRDVHHLPLLDADHPRVLRLCVFGARDAVPALLGGARAPTALQRGLRAL